MLEIYDHSLRFSFPKIHPHARLTVTFQRTLRVPDDVRTYPVPPGLGEFPLTHVDEAKVPKSWIARGGVILPMYQSEALWIDFHKHFVWDHKTYYPFAVKIGTGRINAVTGQNWQGELQADPQDYVVIPGQTWIDGYCVAPGIVRQFVAAPLGAGLSAEEQLTGRAEYGGLQIQVYPMKRSIFEARYPKIQAVNDQHIAEDSPKYSRKPTSDGEHDQRSDPQGRDGICLFDLAPPHYQRVSPPQALSLSPGGRIRQEILEDPFDLADWDQKRTSRCFVHLANSEEWKAMTGTLPPTWLPEAEEYQEAGLPWLELYREAPDIEAEAPRRPRPGGTEEKMNDPETRDNHFPFPRQRKKTGILKGSALLRKLKSLFNMKNS